MVTQESLGIELTMCLVGALASGTLARRRGCSAASFGGLGLFLGLGAIPLTLLATARSGASSPGSGPGFTPAPGPARGRLGEPANVGDDPEAASDVASWADLHRSIQQGLCLGLILALAGFLASFLWMVDGVLPTLVTVFEGMSLKLPSATQVLISVTHVTRGFVFATLWGLTKLVWPTATYWWLLRGGYGLPIVGRVWRHTDRLWQLYALQATGTSDPLPAEVARRLSQGSGPDIPYGASLRRAIGRERDALSSVLWSSVPLLAMAFGAAALAFGLLGLAVLLPLYQLVGNVS